MKNDNEFLCIYFQFLCKKRTYPPIRVSGTGYPPVKLIWIPGVHAVQKNNAFEQGRGNGKKTTADFVLIYGR